MKEIWKNIPGYEGRYQVSNLGNVRSFLGDHLAGRLLRPGKSSNGYLSVTLYKDGKALSHLVQDLVLAAFVGPKPPGQYTRHKDDVRSHNELSNLCYGTPAENYKDVYRLNRTHRKLTAKDVREIRSLLSAGADKSTLASRYGVCERVIRNIRAGRSFAWLE